MSPFGPTPRSRPRRSERERGILREASTLSETGGFFVFGGEVQRGESPPRAPRTRARLHELTSSTCARYPKVVAMLTLSTLSRSAKREMAVIKSASKIGALVLFALVYTGRGQAFQRVDPIRQKAEQGDASAQLNLGALYYTGKGGPQDYAQARKWFLKAAEQGHSDAQFLVGAMYEKGEGGPQDYAQARNWYLKAAEQGHSDAQYNLGALYYTGQGVPQDYVTAHLWFDLAASRAEGRKESADWRDRIAAKMTPAQVAEAQRLAREWKPKPTVR